MQGRIGKLLAFAGAAVFTFFAFVTYFTYWDWVPRTCTLSGCPSAYSAEAIYSYTVHSYPILLMDILGLVMMLGGLRGLANATRTRDRILPVLVGMTISTIIIFLLIYGTQSYATVTTASTITSATTATT